MQLGGTGIEGLYGTMTTSELVEVFAALKKHGMDVGDTFCDIGAGLGGCVASAPKPPTCLQPGLLPSLSKSPSLKNYDYLCRAGLCYSPSYKAYTPGGVRST